MWSSVRLSSVALFVAVASFGALGCTATSAQDPDSEELVEDVGGKGEGVSGGIAVGTQLKSTANVNLRSSATTSASILHVVPEGSIVTVESGTPSNGFYKIKHNGTVGWSSGQYYDPYSSAPPGMAVGDALTATTTVNLRSGPGTSYDVLTTVPTGASVTIVDSTPSNDFLKINYKGTVGWSSGKYYTTSGAVSNPEPDTGGSTGSAATDGAIARAKSGVGFSYWWGHGRFRTEGPTSANKGSCSGGCPSCSHSGTYGGDCSGFVAKAWQVPSTNTNLSTDSHPYSTLDFNKDASQWTSVARANLKPADAMVYNANGAGHIFLYSKGDGWGSMYAYECRGCSAGCIAGYRTASSAYHGIRRKGY